MQTRDRAAGGSPPSARRPISIPQHHLADRAGVAPPTNPGHGKGCIVRRRIPRAFLMTPWRRPRLTTGAPAPTMSMRPELDARDVEDHDDQHKNDHRDASDAGPPSCHSPQHSPEQSSF